MSRLNERGAYYTRVEPDGRVVEVYPLALGRARITISRSLTAMDWTDGWCYDSPILAVCQAALWDVASWDRATNAGEPGGWQRAMNAGRANRYPPQEEDEAT